MNLISKCLYKFLFTFLLVGIFGSLPFTFVPLFAGPEDDINKEKHEDPFLGKTALKYLQDFVKEAQEYNVEMRNYLKGVTEIKLLFKDPTSSTDGELTPLDDPSSLANLKIIRDFALQLHPDKYRKLSKHDPLQAILVELNKKYPFDLVKKAINIVSQKESFKDYILTLSKMSSEPKGEQRELLNKYKHLLKKKTLVEKTDQANLQIELFEEAYQDIAKNVARYIYSLHPDNFDKGFTDKYFDTEQKVDEARKKSDDGETQLKHIQEFANAYIERKGLASAKDAKPYPYLDAYIQKQIKDMPSQEQEKLKIALSQGRIYDQTSLFDYHLDSRVFRRKELKKEITIHHKNSAEKHHSEEISTTYTTKKLVQLGGIMLLLVTLPVGSFIYKALNEYWYNRPNNALNKDISDLRALEVRSEQGDNTNLRRPYIARMKHGLSRNIGELEEQPGNALLVALLISALLIGGGSLALYSYK